MGSEHISAGGSGRSRSARLLLASLVLLAGGCTSGARVPATAEATDRAVSNSDLAATHNDRGDALSNQGKLAEATVEYREAIRLDPNLGVAHASLGVVLFNQGELEQAVAEFQEASRLEPTNADLWLHLGQLYEQLGRGEDALHSLQTGLEADPGNAGILNQFGWIYATAENPALRDPAKALAYAQRAVEASNGGDANILDTLAEAYYVNQEFDEAIKTEQRALEIAPEQEALQNQLKKFREAKATESSR